MNISSFVNKYIQYETTIKQQQKKLNELKERKKYYENAIEKYLKTRSKNSLAYGKNKFTKNKKIKKSGWSKKFLSENIESYFIKKKYSKKMANKISEDLLNYLEANKTITKNKVLSKTHI